MSINFNGSGAGVRAPFLPVRFLENILGREIVHWDHEPRQSAAAAEMTDGDSPSPIGWEWAGVRAPFLPVRFLARVPFLSSVVTMT
jgi:hypothetical protein